MAKLHRELYKQAELILQSGDHDQRDQFGVPIADARVYGLRMGNYALLYLHIEVEDPTVYPDCEDEIFEFEGRFELDQVLSKAERSHNSYNDGFPIDYCIPDGKELKDRTKQVLTILDKHYKPSEDLVSTPPSTVYKIISEKTEFESGKEWTWHNETLFLTQSVLKRAGRFNSKDMFDESLYSIFTTLRYDVEKVKLTFYNSNLSLYKNIQAVKKRNKIQEIEEKIRKKKENLSKTKAKVKRYEKAIMDLYDELRVIKILKD